jgi:hypothetical protein
MTPKKTLRRGALAAAALLPLLLAGCGLHRYHHPGGYGGPAPDPANPQVRVDSQGRLSVDQEPLRFYKAQGPVTITWRLPPDGRYGFPADGIVVEGAGSREEFQCGPGKLPFEFSCLNRNTHPGDYKYSVRALQDGKPLPPLDPRIINDW